MSSPSSLHRQQREMSEAPLSAAPPVQLMSVKHINYSRCTDTNLNHFPSLSDPRTLFCCSSCEILGISVINKVSSTTAAQPQSSIYPTVQSVANDVEQSLICLLDNWLDAHSLYSLHSISNPLSIHMTCTAHFLHLCNCL